MIKRSQSIKIRVTEEEHRELLRRKAGPELAPWMRQVCLGQPLPKTTVTRSDPALVRQIAIMGNNLNQIARYVNKERAVDGLASRALVRMQADLQELIKNAD